nr:hypothetical protein [Streptomyces sp. YIM 121038]
MEERLHQAGKKLAIQRRPFDVGAGLRRLAEDGGYVLPATHVSSVSRAGHQLSVVVRWFLNQPRATVHMERLATAIGNGGPEDGTEPLADLDIHGAHVFACMLHLADHPESAQFWWQLAAGAGHRGAAYCLHLHHLGRGETTEGQHWLHELQHALDGPDIDFVIGMGQFAVYMRDNHPPVPQGAGLTAEVERLASRGDAEPVLVCRPEREIADRLQHFAQQP